MEDELSYKDELSYIYASGGATTRGDTPEDEQHVGAFVQGGGEEEEG